MQQKTRLPRILFVMRDDGGCGFYRCIQPATFIRRMGLADTSTVLKNPTDEQILSSDLVVMQEMGGVNATRMVQFMKKNRIPYIAEFDDFIQHVSPNNTSGYPAWNPSTLYIYRAMELARSASAITVSTDQLAREYFPYNQSVYVIPNYLDEEKWSNPLVRKSDGKVRIGWAGGNAHADDLKMISNVLHRVVKEGKGKVIFETMGMTKRELTNVFPFQDHGESCAKCGYEGELHHFPGEALQEYPLVLSTYGWDIAVAPVIDNSFGNAKSDLKIKEYSALGVPIIASSVSPYRAAKRNGANIILGETYDEWYKALKYMVKNQKVRDTMARENKEWVKQYWIQNNAQKIFEVYAQVMHRHELLFGKRDMV